MEYQTILVEKDEHKVATVTLNRPQMLNSFNGQMCFEFRHLWQSLRVDDTVNAIVVRAAPGRAFSAGYDVKDSGGAANGFSDHLWAKEDAGEYLGPKANKLWKPIVTAVHGICAGGGFYWVNESDIVICSENAEFFDPHVTYGMVTALEPIGLSKRIPLSEALRIGLMGNDERVGAQTALRINLVSEVVPNDELWDRAAVIARRIAAKPTAATQGTVRAVWDSLDQTRTSALDNAMKYLLLGNPLGRAEVDRPSIMAAAKQYDVR
jgi:enoyl-CoA hydratase/carnithine racemase